MSAAAASAAIIADSVAAACTSIHAKRRAPGNAQHCSTASLRARPYYALIELTEPHGAGRLGICAARIHSLAHSDRDSRPRHTQSFLVQVAKAVTRGGGVLGV